MYINKYSSSYCILQISKIQDMKNTEKMAECLVDQLMIKPDRAFDEFVSALRDTGQHHVANLLDFRSKEGSYFISA